MIVQFTLVGHVQRETIRVEMDAVPREGDTVCLPGWPEHGNSVRTVVWYPKGDGVAADQPFVYVVVGPERRDGW